MRGFSARNHKYMRNFAAAWRDASIVQRAVARLPWGHVCSLLDRVRDEGTRDWYVAKAREEGGSRTILDMQIRSRAHEGAFDGQMNLNLSAVDDLLRNADDKPTIGLLLCRSKNKVVVEYALRHLKRPIGVAEWETELVDKLPAELKGSLPTVEEIEAELACGRKGTQP